MAIPRVTLAHLELKHTTARPEYAVAVENLAVGLSRCGVAIVQLQCDAVEAGLDAMLSGKGKMRCLPGCVTGECRMSSPQDVYGAVQAYGAMDYVARTLLAAICRSSLLRLRADAFSPVLDDLPPPRGSQGSSLLTARSFSNNFCHLSPAEYSSVAPLFADPQVLVAETTERGLLSLFYVQEAVNEQREAMSAMQVQGCDGVWRDVRLQAGEVAVVLGATMTHASVGLLRPACHRVVGEPFGPDGVTVFGGCGRRMLQFDLCPCPAAVLDLRGQLEAAGHTLSARYAAPVSVSILMEQFESLLSPSAKVATPDQQQAAAAHAAWVELQAQTAAKKKRPGSLLGEGTDAALSRAVTRSGAVLRSDGGLVNRRSSSRFAKQQAAGVDAMEADLAQQAQQAQQHQGGRRRSTGGGSRDSGASSGSASASAPAFSLGSGASSEGGGQAPGHEPPATTLYVVRGRTCTVLGGCLRDDPADCLTLCVRSFTGLERWFYVSASANLGRVFETYCSRLGICLGACKFLLRGSRVFGASTPLSLRMKDGDELTAVPESADRLRTAAELGPLFAQIFGADAAKGVPADLPL